MTDSPKNDWSLFLDRDGVINCRLPGDYVKSPEQFVFLDGVKSALAKLSGIFSTIIIVTNQQGIGKKIMTEKDLERIHQSMLEEIRQSGGRIDAVFHCPALATENHPDRKPAPGMALNAQKQFQQLQFNKSIMVGDSKSDILFGKNLGMITVYLTTNEDQQDFGADFRFTGLAAFASWLETHQNSILL